MLWIKLRKLNAKNLQDSRPTSVIYGEPSVFHHSPIRGAERILMCLVIVAGLTFIVGTGNTIMESYYDRVYEYHNVKLVKVINEHSWLLVKADGPFRADFCNDYDVSSLNPTPGEVLAKIRYIDMGNCWSVKREDLGFWWKRDPNGWTIKETDQ